MNKKLKVPNYPQNKLPAAPATTFQELAVEPGLLDLQPPPPPTPLLPPTLDLVLRDGAGSDDGEAG